MADAVITKNLEERRGHTNGQRAYRGWKATFDTVGVNSGEIDKRGYAIVGFMVPVAFVQAATAAIHVSYDSGGTFVAHPDIPAIDLSAPTVVTTDYLVEWPYFKIVLNTAETSSSKVIEVVLS